jgi:hypothetical protein
MGDSARAGISQARSGNFKPPFKSFVSDAINNVVEGAAQLIGKASNGIFGRLARGMNLGQVGVERARRGSPGTGCPW